jgi:hypothetical protein
MDGPGPDTGTVETPGPDTPGPAVAPSDSGPGLAAVGATITGMMTHWHDSAGPSLVSVTASVRLEHHNTSRVISKMLPEISMESMRFARIEAKKS